MNRKWARVNYQPGVGLGENGARVTADKEHITLSKDAAKEGMVLLKNEQHVLPLQTGAKVALFGKATFDYVWILFSIVVGGDLFGIVGMVVGVPVFATLYGLTQEFVHYALDKRGIDSEGNPVEHEAEDTENVFE